MNRTLSQVRVSTPFLVEKKGGHSFFFFLTLTDKLTLVKKLTETHLSYDGVDKESKV